MKLALVRRQYSTTGGAELYLQGLLAALAGAGHEVHLLAESWVEAPSGIRVHRLTCARSRARRATQFADAVETELGRERFDCVFSLERTRRQDVYRAGDGVHRVWLQRRREFAPWWRKPWVARGAFHRHLMDLETKTLDPANTRRILVNSEMVKRDILQHFGFPPERIHLVRNGVDVPRFRRPDRAGARTRFGLKPDEFVLLFVGSGWERKGLRFLLEALAHYEGEQVTLLVIGKGRKPLSTPGNVVFLGPVRDVEVACAAADLFAFLPIYDPSANVCYEALASGLPVVTSALNGAAEIIEAGVNGSVVANPADIPAVIRAIDHWRSRPSARPVATPVDLSLERNVSETLALLELTVGEKRGRRG